MLDGLLRLVAPRPPLVVVRDVVDVLVVAWLIYRALLVIRGTRGMPVLAGFFVGAMLYGLAYAFQLVTLHAVFSWIVPSALIVAIILFQDDIRRALSRFGSTAWSKGRSVPQTVIVDEVVAAATELARHRMGALIAFQRDGNIRDFVKNDAIPVDSVVSKELLVSFFVPESVNKLHDGAAIIQAERITVAGAFFPMPEARTLDAQYGSRHRAAIGITEVVDAVVVVVSEERGTISLCCQGRLRTGLDGEALRRMLTDLLVTQSDDAPAREGETPASMGEPRSPGSGPRHALPAKPAPLLPDRGAKVEDP